MCAAGCSAALLFEASIIPSRDAHIFLGHLAIVLDARTGLLGS